MTSGFSRRILPCLGLALFALFAFPAATVATAQELPAGWLDVDYRELVDLRAPSHSGEPVGELLRKLEGRPLPPPGERPVDAVAHSLLEPLVEGYAFVLRDALDSLQPLPDPAWVDVGSLWHPGTPQPAWVELLRARRLLVESDGAGRLRLILPDPASGAPGDSADAGRRALEAYWPVLRHVVAAERQRRGRLTGRGANSERIRLEVHAYRHRPALSLFLLGTEPHRMEVRETRPDGSRPPLDLAAIEAFLAEGLQLEGGRLEDDGSLRLLGSRPETPPGLLGRSATVADLAVAYRAVFHGGLAEPYMSLDRGYSPQTSIVNYGGRLQDTALGLVSLLCDIRFKTFSVGYDIVDGRDRRREVRADIGDFRTHIERFAADPTSAAVMAQQTRLWFYPDQVDMTVSVQGDVLAMRTVRMSAASERYLDETLQEASADPPWTRRTIEAINTDYDRLAKFFPELRDLDQVVRMLAFFTWLREARSAGLPTPELDTLLAVALPARWTPREFPQMLSFNALPPAGDRGPVETFGRVPVAEALDRLNPAGPRPLPARRRFARSAAALDPAHPQMGALREQMLAADLARLNDTEMDFFAFRAERQRMHLTVLRSLDAERREAIAGRREAGNLRVFSVGIGGLDLGMGPVLDRASARSLGLGATSSLLGAPRSAPTDSARVTGSAPPQEWRRDPAGLPFTELPDHGGVGDFAGHRTETGTLEDGTSWIRTIFGPDGSQVRSRRTFLDRNRRVRRVERLEKGRLLAYGMARDGSRLHAEPLGLPEVPSLSSGTVPAELPDGLATLQLALPADAGPGESPTLRVELAAPAGPQLIQIGADFPRGVLQRLVLGREADLMRDEPLPGLSPLPPTLGALEALMVVADGTQTAAPWEGSRRPLAGEEDPLRVARALNAWWRNESPGYSAVVGTDLDESPGRWDRAPRPSGGIPLLLPVQGLDATLDGGLRGELDAAWNGPVLEELPAAITADLIVLVSAEAPGALGERLRALAEDPRLSGKLLAVVPLAAPLRQDLPASLLRGGGLAGVGVAETGVVARRTTAQDLADFARELADGGRRVERPPGPFLWFF